MQSRATNKPVSTKKLTVTEIDLKLKNSEEEVSSEEKLEESIPLRNMSVEDLAHLDTLDTQADLSADLIPSITPSLTTPPFFSPSMHSALFSPPITSLASPPTTSLASPNKRKLERNSSQSETSNLQTEANNAKERQLQTLKVNFAEIFEGLEGGKLPQKLPGTVRHSKSSPNVLKKRSKSFGSELLYKAHSANDIVTLKAIENLKIKSTNLGLALAAAKSNLQLGLKRFGKILQLLQSQLVTLIQDASEKLNKFEDINIKELQDIALNHSEENQNLLLEDINTYLEALITFLEKEAVQKIFNSTHLEFVSLQTILRKYLGDLHALLSTTTKLNDNEKGEYVELTKFSASLQLLDTQYVELMTSLSHIENEKNTDREIATLSEKILTLDKHITNFINQSLKNLHSKAVARFRIHQTIELEGQLSLTPLHVKVEKTSFIKKEATIDLSSNVTPDRQVFIVKDIIDKGSHIYTHLFIHADKSGSVTYYGVIQSDKKLEANLNNLHSFLYVQGIGYVKELNGSHTFVVTQSSDEESLYLRIGLNPGHWFASLDAQKILERVNKHRETLKLPDNSNMSKSQLVRMPLMKDVEHEPVVAGGDLTFTPGLEKIAIIAKAGAYHQDQQTAQVQPSKNISKDELLEQYKNDPEKFVEKKYAPFKSVLEHFPCLRKGNLVSYEQTLFEDRQSSENINNNNNNNNNNIKPASPQSQISNNPNSFTSTIGSKDKSPVLNAASEKDVDNNNTGSPKSPFRDKWRGKTM